jgi:ribosomal protein L32E
MESMKLAEHVNVHFTKPKSNRGFMPSTYIQTLVLMQHQGHFHLIDATEVVANKADAH